MMIYNFYIFSLIGIIRIKSNYVNLIIGGIKRTFFIFNNIFRSFFFFKQK